MRNIFVVSMLAALAAASLAVAKPPTVEHSGGVFHKRVCDTADVDGEAQCHAHVVTDDQGNDQGRSDKDLKAALTTPNGFGPADLRAAYAVTGSGASTTTVAIVDAYGYPNAEADLAVYRSTYGLPPCTTANGCFGKYNQSGVKGSYPTTNVGWSQETALDLDMVSAMCPNCKIILVEATTNSYTNLASAVATAGTLGAHVISNSYGGGETSSSSTYEVKYNQPGRAVLASSGDAGYKAQFPATSPHVIAVGGTSLVRDTSARGWGETVWAKTGSGCSAYFAKPSWQHDTGCAKRMEADVSAVADPATGVAVYGPNSKGVSTWLVFGGTSVSAPLVGGIYGVNGGTVNYGADPYANLGALNDVTSGSNGTCTVAYFCNAAVGYDGPTGLGTPIGVTAF